MVARSTKPKAERSETAQVKHFQELARRLECDEDEKAFEKKVKAVAKAPPKSDRRDERS